jgi:hypothetical protein
MAILCCVAKKGLRDTVAIIYNFSPWEDIVRKKVSKLRSIAELRAFDGTQYERNSTPLSLSLSRIRFPLV